MLTVAVRALRPATLATRSATRTPLVALRPFTTTLRSSSGAQIPQIFGSGSKPGEVPTDQSQATGLERFQLLGELEGVSAFDMEPLDSSRVGTAENPIKVMSLVRCCFATRFFFFNPTISLQDTERIVGCTGSPADSHNLLWFSVYHDKQARCGECGSGQYTAAPLLSVDTRLTSIPSLCPRFPGRIGRSRP